jgi:hypothetical protein
MKSLPEYTLSLFFWIAPVFFFMSFLLARKLLGRAQRKALFLNLAVLAAVGCGLDILFAHLFFCFPNRAMTLHLDIRGIPVEEFLFYFFGFWFIIALYIFNDEFFLRRYNIDDSAYHRFARRLRKSFYVSISLRSAAWLAALVCGFLLVKYLAAENGAYHIPGYILFLAFFAYVPYFAFWKLSRRFVNVPALAFTVVITTLVSVIWEITLALPRGYWGYRPDYMLGVFVPVWHNAPIEALTVWVFSSLIVLSYEYTKLLLLRDQTAVNSHPDKRRKLHTF